MLLVIRKFLFTGKQGIIKRSRSKDKRWRETVHHRSLARLQWWDQWQHNEKVESFGKFFHEFSRAWAKRIQENWKYSLSCHIKYCAFLSTWEISCWGPKRYKKIGLTKTITIRWTSPLSLYLSLMKWQWNTILRKTLKLKT